MVHLYVLLWRNSGQARYLVSLDRPGIYLLPRLVVTVEANEVQWVAMGALYRGDAVVYRVVRTCVGAVAPELVIIDLKIKN